MDVIIFQRRQLIKVDCASRIVPDEVTEIARKEIGKVFPIFKLNSDYGIFFLSGDPITLLS